ncbi:benenodin family lasso peptide [Novosphingobium sp. BL-52-GroH]
MNNEHDRLDEEFVDLGSVTTETNGFGGDNPDDVGLRRQDIGILAD